MFRIEQADTHIMALVKERSMLSPVTPLLMSELEGRLINTGLSNAFLLQPLEHNFASVELIRRMASRDVT